MLGAIFPSFKFMKNTLPASAAITTQDLIGFLIYVVVYAPILYVIKPHQLRLGLYPTFITTCVTFTGILIWALVSNGGTGDLIGSTLDLTTSQKAFRFMQCLSSISGTWGGSGDRYSDWSRFEKKRGTSIPGLFALPIVVTISTLFGVLTTTATTKMYGFVQWNPILLLQYTQTVSYTPACRAGTFFVGFALFWAQVFLNMSQNSIPQGMDISGGFPRYFTTKRAAFMMLILTVIVQPWRFLSQAVIFLTILSATSGKNPSLIPKLAMMILIHPTIVYFAAGTAIVLGDYWIIRKKMLKVPDLYKGEDGIYWYTKGINYRCIFALLAGSAPCLPGFFMICINPVADNAWVKMFQICWFISAPLALIIYQTLNYIWPVEGLGIQEFIPMGEGAVEVIEATSSAASTDGKVLEETTTKVEV
jgi:NCS1 family nucleobase:cation symporter-1